LKSKLQTYNKHTQNTLKSSQKNNKPKNFKMQLTKVLFLTLLSFTGAFAAPVEAGTAAVAETAATLNNPQQYNHNGNQRDNRDWEREKREREQRERNERERYERERREREERERRERERNQHHDGNRDGHRDGNNNRDGHRDGNNNRDGHRDNNRDGRKNY